MVSSIGAGDTGSPKVANLPIFRNDAAAASVLRATILARSIHEDHASWTVQARYNGGDNAGCHVERAHKWTSICSRVGRARHESVPAQTEDHVQTFVGEEKKSLARCDKSGVIGFNRLRSAGSLIGQWQAQRLLGRRAGIANDDQLLVSLAVEHQIA